MKVRSALCLLAGLTLVGVVQAQTTDFIDSVEIIMDIEGQTSFPREMSVLIENEPVAHVATKSDGHWVWTTDRPIAFDRLTGHARVRFGTARTDCRGISSFRNDPGGTLVVVFRFDAISRIPRLRDVRVITNPAIDVSYVRRFPDDTRIGCADRPSFRGDRTIFDVRLPPEGLFLQLGSKAPNQQLKGLPVTEGKRFVRSDVILTLAKQRANGRAYVAPNFSSMAISLDELRIGKLKDIRVMLVDATVGR